MKYSQPQNTYTYVGQHYIVLSTGRYCGKIAIRKWLCYLVKNILKFRIR